MAHEILECSYSNLQVDQKKKNEILHTICVVMWDDIQHTLLAEKSKVQDSENTCAAICIKRRLNGKYITECICINYLWKIHKKLGTLITSGKGMWSGWHEGKNWEWDNFWKLYYVDVLASQKITFKRTCFILLLFKGVRFQMWFHNI